MDYWKGILSYRGEWYYIYVDKFYFFKGIITRYYRLIALSLIIVFLYGGMMWYLFPIEEGISWEGHLSGFLVGMILAFNIKTPELKRVVYAWESLISMKMKIHL